MASRFYFLWVGSRAVNVNKQADSWSSQGENCLEKQKEMQLYTNLSVAISKCVFAQQDKVHATKLQAQVTHHKQYTHTHHSSNAAGTLLPHCSDNMEDINLSFHLALFPADQSSAEHCTAADTVTEGGQKSLRHVLADTFATKNPLPAVNHNGTGGRFRLDGVHQFEGVDDCPVARRRGGAAGGPVQHLELGHFPSQAKLLAKAKRINTCY